MKRKLKIPPKPTMEETEKLKRFIWMADWHFEVTIKKKCTEISSEAIYWVRDKEDSHWIKATVFGLKAVKGEEQESCIANIFIRYQAKVYQTTDINQAVETIRLIKKDVIFDEYKEKLWQQKWNAKKKLIATNQKERAKVKKLRVEPKKKVA